MNPQHREDPTLVIRAKDDIAAAEELLGRYKSAIRYWVVTSAGGAVDGPYWEDLQAVGNAAFVNAVQAYLPTKGTFSGFAKAFVRQRVIDEIRKQVVASGGVPRTPRREPPDALPPHQETYPSPEELLVASERSEALTSALDRLPRDDQYIVFLRFVDGMTFAEIAETLGVTRGYIQQRLGDALCRLRNALYQR